jgi:hypothetical protein
MRRRYEDERNRDKEKKRKNAEMFVSGVAWKVRLGKIQREVIDQDR